MRGMKTCAAVAGVVCGTLAFAYLFASDAMTLRDMGLSVAAQIVAQRVVTLLVILALASLAASAEHFRRVVGAKVGASYVAKVARLALVVVMPAVVVFSTLNTPFWSYPSPLCWDRPRFDYGWLAVWKSERTGCVHMGAPMLNLFVWTLYAMAVLGYRRKKQYRTMLIVMAVLFCLYATFVGIGTISRRIQHPSMMNATMMLKAMPCA